MCKKKVLVTLSGGGYENEAIMLLGALRDRFDYAYVTSDDAAWYEPAVPVKGKMYTLPAIIRKLDPSKPKAVINFFIATLKAAKIVFTERPSAIIGVGAPLSLPLFICGRMLGSRCVFIESITRTEKLSLTGRLAGRFHLVDRIYVQWETLATSHPKALYRGTVL